MRLFVQVKYQDRDVIVREGAEADTFYIILKGEVRLGLLINGIRTHTHIRTPDHLRPLLPPLCSSPAGPGD